MVRLLHHYETSTHRIFLLLEYVGGGRLIDFVAGKREQWTRLHEAVTNPPSSSSLIIPDSPMETTPKDPDGSRTVEEGETVGKTGNSGGKGEGVCSLLCAFYMCTCSVHKLILLHV